MKAGINNISVNNFPDPQQAPVERQRIVKSKTIGGGAEIPNENFKATESKQKISKREKLESSNEEQALKAQAEMLDRAKEMRYVQYEVIEEASIVQMSVINEDGTVVRKVPQDNVVELVKSIREHQNSRLDMKA